MLEILSRKSPVRSLLITSVRGISNRGSQITESLLTFNSTSPSNTSNVKVRKLSNFEFGQTIFHPPKVVCF